MKNSNEILIASSNQGKVKEFKKLFQDHKIFSLSDFDIEDAIENGSSFFENALIKAKHGSLYSEKFTIADDSGLVVPDLDFEPGIYSARYAGEGASDKENRDHLINKLNLIKKEELDARNPVVQRWEKLMWTYQQALPSAKPGQKWVQLERIFQLSNSSGS